LCEKNGVCTEKERKEKKKITHKANLPLKKKTLSKRKKKGKQ